MARIEEDPGRFKVTCGGYTLECTPYGLPLIYDRLKQNAALAEEIALREPSHCCLTVKRAGEHWPFLVVAQSYAPSGVGFEPGVLLALETKVLFVGAGERILAYRLEPPERIWEDHVNMGFLAWEQHGDTVLLAAELELAAWSTAGEKRWTTFVEPPWSFTVLNDVIEVDVMGRKTSFDLREGPPKERKSRSR
jgi:hypothetical protein